MSDEMRGECVELSITACEKFGGNYEVSATSFKKQNVRESTLILEYVILPFICWLDVGNSWQLNQSKRQWTKNSAPIGM